jgi:dGTPase
MFIIAVNNYHESGDKLRKEDVLSDKLIDILPKQFLGNDGYPEEDIYSRILQICEFIAGMTDTYAISLFKRLSGYSL